MLGGYLFYFIVLGIKSKILYMLPHSLPQAFTSEFWANTVLLSHTPSLTVVESRQIYVTESPYTPAIPVSFMSTTFLKMYFMCMHGGQVCTVAHMWRPEENFWE